MTRILWRAGLVPTMVLAVACGGDGPTTPTEVACEGGDSPTVVDLQPGEAYVSPDAAAASCIELAEGSGRYLLAVVNSNTAPGASIGIRMRGIGASAANIAASEVSLAEPQGPGLSSAAAALVDGEIEYRAGHRQMLRRNHQLLASLPRRDGRIVTPGIAAANIGAEAVSSIVGSVSTVRIADIDSDVPLCRDLPFHEIEARTVYSGTRAIIVEDVAAPLAGQMDDILIGMGVEFDQVMWPILTANFGDPLKLDSELDGNERLVMVMSQRVNNFQRSVAGFVISCDFGARTQIPSSNEGEYFYAMVPTDASAGFSGLTRDNWRRIMRSTLIHEVKHITAYAERLSRTAPFEEEWLEEASAMLAEELFARSVYGRGWKENITYQQSVYCDIRPTFPECLGAPSIMIAHFALMYDYLKVVEILSPTGEPPGASGSTFYGSGWSLLRWAVDQYATSEPAFLMPLTQGPLTGVQNLQARTGRSWGEMIANWSLANSVDDRAGFVPQSALITHPSWQYRNMYAQLRNDLPNIFDRAYPLLPRQIFFGEFTSTVTQVNGSTAVHYELSGSAAGRQLLELRSAQGGALPAAVRIGIVRVQ